LLEQVELRDPERRDSPQFFGSFITSAPNKNLSNSFDLNKKSRGLHACSKHLSEFIRQGEKEFFWKHEFDSNQNPANL
jgi:hypothetical protein